ncbi:hypothetical protein D3C71_1840780 [compost metagenome]
MASAEITPLTPVVSTSAASAWVRAEDLAQGVISRRCRWATVVRWVITAGSTAILALARLVALTTCRMSCVLLPRKAAPEKSTAVRTAGMARRALASSSTLSDSRVTSPRSFSRAKVSSAVTVAMSAMRSTGMVLRSVWAR